MNAQFSTNVSITLKRSGMSCSLGLVTRFQVHETLCKCLKSPVSWTVHRAKVAKKCLQNRARPCCGELPSLCMKGKGPGGYSWEFLVGVCCPVLQILTLLQTKKCYFPHPFSDQTYKMRRQEIFLDLNSLKTPFLGFWFIQTGYWPVPFSWHEALQTGGLFHQG